MPFCCEWGTESDPVPWDLLQERVSSRLEFLAECRRCQEAFVSATNGDFAEGDERLCSGHDYDLVVPYVRGEVDGRPVEFGLSGVWRATTVRAIEVLLEMPDQVRTRMRMGISREEVA